MQYRADSLLGLLHGMCVDSLEDMMLLNDEVKAVTPGSTVAF